MTTTPASFEKEDAPMPTRHSLLSRVHLFTDVDPAEATAPMVAYTFMTGWMDVVVFSAIFGWPGFQTGNTAQLAIALARTFQNRPEGGHDGSFHLADQLALTSVLTFLAGAFLGRIGDRMGAKTRAWLVLGTFIQALFTMAAALAIWRSGSASISDARSDIAWTNAKAFVALGFISASLGLQGIMGKRVNTQFATTIVLTTVWCELMADPKLFHFRTLVKSRDHKILGVVALILGAFLGRTLLQASGSAVTLGVAAGLRALISLSFLWVKGKAS